MASELPPPVSAEEHAAVWADLNDAAKARRGAERDVDRLEREHEASLAVGAVVREFDLDPRNPAGSQMTVYFDDRGRAGVGSRDHDWCLFDPSPEFAEFLIDWLKARQS